MSKFPKIRSTTVVAVKRNGCVAMAGDGQVTNGQTVMKGNAKKVRKIYDGKIITGFAGSVADAFTLFDKFVFIGVKLFCIFFVSDFLRIFNMF